VPKNYLQNGKKKHLFNFNNYMMKSKFLILSVLMLIFTLSIQAQKDDEFDEFGNTEIIDSNKTQKDTVNDEFANDDEFASDEFSDDEFSDDEFSSGDASEEFSNNSDSDEPVSYNRLYWAIAVLLYTILAGILVRFKGTRKLRGLFLMILRILQRRSRSNFKFSEFIFTSNWS